MPDPSLPALAADPSEWEAQGFIMLDDMLDIYLGEESDVVIPDGVAKIGPNSFAGAAEQLTSVTIPASVSQIDSEALDYCKGAVLHVEEGSEAENFALRHNLNYESDYQDFIKTAQSGGQETAPEDAAAQDQPVSQPTQEDSSGSPVVIIVVVIVAAAAAGGGYLVLKKKKG